MRFDVAVACLARLSSNPHSIDNWATRSSASTIADGHLTDRRGTVVAGVCPRLPFTGRRGPGDPTNPLTRRSRVTQKGP